jgi:hypothetical protein
MFWAAVTCVVIGFQSPNFLLKASIAFLWGLLFLAQAFYVLYLFTDLYTLGVRR